MPETDIRSFSKDFDVTYSFLYHYLTKIIPKTKRLVIYMDNCIGTNKNNFAFDLYYYFVHTLNLLDEI